MKLRILGNKLRLRLTQTEVSMLEQGNNVIEQTCFEDSNLLEYQILVDLQSNKITSSFLNNRICVTIPAHLLTNWSTDEREGLYSDNGNIAIEKDFQCLHKRPDENEQDNFKNPAKTE